MGGLWRHGLINILFDFIIINVLLLLLLLSLF